jgi:predicted house-cleaning noncanonical NTP pyrophosphatase (MazG superfamily)
MCDMGRVYYNKLIRDKVPAKIEGKGEQCEVRSIADDQEYEQELLKKVSEEAQALSRVRSREEFLDEYADLMAVLDALRELKKCSDAEIIETYERNVAKKGLFTKRYFLHWSSDTDYTSNETPQGMKS